MKFRILLVLAILVFAVALSAATVTFHVRCNGPVPTRTAMLRAFQVGEEAPRWTVFELPRPGETFVMRYHVTEDPTSIDAFKCQVYLAGNIYEEITRDGGDVYFTLP